MEPLRTDELAEFRHRGYLVLEGRFDDRALAAMRAAADRILELAINSSVALGQRHPRTDAKLHDDGRTTMRKIQPVNDLDPVLAAIAADERLLGPMRQLMEDDPVLMEEKLDFKQTLDTRHLDLGFLRTSSFSAAGGEAGLEGFHLHHDWGYYRQQGYPENTLSSAVSVDDCAGRGPIRVIPGSHFVDVPLADPDPACGSGVVADGVVDAADLVPIDAPAGSVMVFHAKLVHDSEPNRSGLPRRVMIYSHHPRSHDPDADPNRRNGARRVASQQFESRYRALVADGFDPPFSLVG